MAENEPKPESLEVKKQPRNWLNIFGFTLTGAYLLFLGPLARSRWDHLWALDSNEFGDLMAGTFAPLAFLWLVIGYFQQGKELKVSNATLKLQQDELAKTNDALELQRQELRSSVDALERQGEELAKSVQAQTELTEVTRQSVGLQRAKMEKEAKEEALALEPTFNLFASGSPYKAANWRQRFRLENFGHTATNLVVKQVGWDEPLLEMDVFEYRMPKDFLMQFRSAEALSGKIILTCRNGSGKMIARGFSVLQPIGEEFWSISSD